MTATRWWWHQQDDGDNDDEDDTKTTVTRRRWRRRRRWRHDDNDSMETATTATWRRWQYDGGNKTTATWRWRWQWTDDGDMTTAVKTWRQRRRRRDDSGDKRMAAMGTTRWRQRQRRQEKTTATRWQCQVPHALIHWPLAVFSTDSCTPLHTVHCRGKNGQKYLRYSWCTSRKTCAIVYLFLNLVAATWLVFIEITDIWCYDLLFQNSVRVFLYYNNICYVYYVHWLACRFWFMYNYYDINMFLLMNHQRFVELGGEIPSAVCGKGLDGEIA